MWQSAQANPLITGWQIVLSNNHTTLVNGVPLPFKDICDTLQGIYPKTFKFKGWHPQCRCEMLPITITQAERKDLYKSIFDGKREGFNPKSIATPPKEFTQWVGDNEERAKGWANMPYFVRDNAKFVKTRFEVNTYTDEEKKFTQARKTSEAMRRVLDKLAKLYHDIPNTELAAIHHYTRNGGNYRQLNKQMDNGTLSDFNRASMGLISNGLEKLPIYKGTVYRGMIIKKAEFEKVFGGDIGSVVKQDRFVSSSRDMETAKGFYSYREPKQGEIKVSIEIESKKGRDIERISEFNGIFVPDNQREVLFANNTPFKVVKKQLGADGIMHIKMVEQ